MIKAEECLLIDKIMTQNMLKVQKWLVDHPEDVELLCGDSKNLTKEDFVRIYNTLCDINALNLITLFIFRHGEYAQREYNIQFDPVDFLIK